MSSSIRAELSAARRLLDLSVADDRLGQLGDDLPDDLLDDLARELGDRLVLGALGADGGQLLIDAPLAADDGAARRTD